MKTEANNVKKRVKFSPVDRSSGAMALTEDSSERLGAVKSLLSSLKKNPKSSKIVQKVSNASKLSSGLAAALPSAAIQDDKVKRKVGFQDAKKTLDKWSGVVESYRTADTLHFPLRQQCEQDVNIVGSSDTQTVRNTAATLSTFQTRTKLESRLMAILSSSKVAGPSKVASHRESSSTVMVEPKKKPTDDDEEALKEVLERRGAYAKLKASLSYQAAKAARHKKIKSKRYHRLLKKTKKKQEMEELEEEDDADVIAKRMGQLEKARAVERATLRHRNTGRWAQNQIVRAKYNKQSKAALNEQIRINRELTRHQAVAASNSDQEEEEDQKNDMHDEDMSEEYKTFMRSYGDYLKETGQQHQLNEDKRNKKSESVSICIDHRTASNEGNKEQAKQNAVSIKSSSGIWTVLPNDSEVVEKKVQQKKRTCSVENRNKVVRDGDQRKKRRKTAVAASAGSTDVNKQREGDKPKKDVNPNTYYSVAAPAITTSHRREATIKHNSDSSKRAVLATEENDDDDDEESEEDCEQKNALMAAEAFADDDVVAVFEREKEIAEQQSDVTLDTVGSAASLPGWGSWADQTTTAIKKTATGEKQNESSLKISAAKRVDQHRHVILHHETAAMRTHLVNELPYPFESVKDYETSVRCPVGREWQPETAYRDLIAAPVVTKLGTVIEPISRNQCNLD